jgi:indolepyruvate ferredoxin oxidoreductase
VADAAGPGASVRQETKAMADAVKGPVDLPQDLQSTSLDDKYDLTKRRIFVSGPQAIVRLLLMQKELDRRNGLDTAGFISGYRGSAVST